MNYNEIGIKYQKKRKPLQGKIKQYNDVINSLSCLLTTHLDAIDVLVKLNEQLIKYNQNIPTDMTEIEKVNKKYIELIRDENLLVRNLEEKVSSVRKEISGISAKINKLNKERLIEMGKARKELRIEEYGFDLEIGEIYNVKFDKVPKKDLIHNKTKLKIGNYVTDGDFHMNIIGETNLRYNLELVAENGGKGFNEIRWSGYGSKKIKIQMTKDKLMGFLDKYSQAMKRKVNLIKILDI